MTLILNIDEKRTRKAISINNSVTNGRDMTIGNRTNIVQEKMISMRGVVEMMKTDRIENVTTKRHGIDQAILLGVKIMRKVRRSMIDEIEMRKIHVESMTKRKRHEKDLVILRPAKIIRKVKRKVRSERGQDLDLDQELSSDIQIDQAMV